MALTAGSIEIKLFADIARLQSDMNKANKTVDAAMRNIDKSVGLAKRAFSSLAVSFSALQVIKLADNFKRFDSQLKLSTKNLETYTQAYENVIRISRVAQSEIGAVGVLYSRLNNNLRDFNVTQSQVAGVTETIALALRTNNATVQETNSVMLQLSQSFGSGKLNGQEFLAVAEGAPLLLRQLAKSMGVPFGALKDLSAQGKITREELLKAFTDPEYLAALRTQVKEVGTVSSAMTVFINNLKLFVGEQDKATGASKVFVKTIMFLADNINVVATVGIVALVVSIGKFTASLLANIQAIIARNAALANEARLLAASAAAEAAKTAATISSTASINAYLMKSVAATTATTLATRAMGGLRLAVAALGGPIGAITTALGLGITAWMAWGNTGKTSANDLATAIERVKKGLESIDDAKMIQTARAAAVIEKMRAEKPLGTLDILGYSSREAALEAQRVKVDALSKQIKEYDAVLAKHNQTQKENSVNVTEADKALERLAKANKVLSLEVAEQKALIADAKLAYDAKLITLADYNKVVADANKKIADLTGATKALKAEEKDRQKWLKEMVKEQEDFLKAQEKARDDQIEAIDKQNEAVQKEIDKLNESIYTAQYGEEAYRKLEISRLNDAVATAEQTLAQVKLSNASRTAIKYVEDYISALKEQIALKEKANELENTEEMWKRAKKIEADKVEAAKDAAEEIKKANDKMADDLNKALTDSIMRGFESGKSFAKNFRDSLINYFKTLVLRPIISFIVDSTGITKVLGAVLGGISGTSAAGTAETAVGGGILDSFVAGGKNIFYAVVDGFDTANIAFEQSIQKFGTWVTSFGTEGSALTNLGGMISQYSDTIAKALPYAGSVIKLLSGDVKGAAFTAAGTAIGSAIGGPVGGMIGSFLGGMVGGLFGGKKKLPRYTTLLDTTYQNGIFKAGTAYKSGDSKGIIKDAIAPITQLSQAFTTTLGALLKSAGLSSDMTTSAMIYKKNNTIGRFIANIGGQQYKTSFSGGEDVNATFSRLINETFTIVMIDAIKGSDLQQGIKDLFNNLSTKEDVMSMAQAAITLNDAAKGIENKFGLTVNQVVQLGNTVTSTNEELIAFINTLSTIGKASITLGEGLLKVKQSLSEAIGGTLPTNLAEFDARLKSIDKTTQEGINTFAQLLSLREGFITFENAIKELSGGVDAAIFKLLTPAQQFAKLQIELGNMFGALNVNVPKSVQELIALGESIDLTTKEGLNLAAIFPTLVDSFMATKQAGDSLIGTMKELSSNSFRTLVDFTRAQAYAANGISLSRLPSYDVGTSYVPQTGPAMIHQGERILTASENSTFTASQAELAAEIRGLRMDNQEMRRELQSIAISTKSTAKVMDRQDRDGIIIRDVNNEGDPQILKVEIV